MADIVFNCCLPWEKTDFILEKKKISIYISPSVSCIFTISEASEINVTLWFLVCVCEVQKWSCLSPYLKYPGKTYKSSILYVLYNLNILCNYLLSLSSSSLYIRDLTQLLKIPHLFTGFTVSIIHNWVCDDL